MAAGAGLVGGGCGSGASGGPSTARSTGSTSATRTTNSPGPAKQTSVDQHRARSAVLAHLAHRGYKSLKVDCQATRRGHFDCRVNGAQLWQAVVTPGGSVRLRLLGSE